MNKKTSKKYLIIALCFSIIAAFTLFIYEPLVMYSGNIDEFWFDLGILMSVTVWPFLITAGLLGVVYTLVFFITRKKPLIFYIMEIVSFAGFIYFYIHGNFLTNILPTLYDEFINWWSSDFIIGHTISAVLFVVIIIMIIFSIKNFSAEKTAGYSFYVVMAFSVMMLVSFVATLTTPGIFVDKEVQSIATAKNIRKISTNKNFYILLVDCTDSEAFNSFIEEKYQDDFKDFVYYKDSAPGYSLTRDSIPLIFSGVYNKNEVQFNKFSTEAFDNSKTFAYLEGEGYSLNLYSEDVVWNSKKSATVSNFSNDISNYNKKSFLKQEVKYILYKYLPFAFKSFSRIESINFMLAIQRGSIDDVVDWKNMYYYENVLSEDSEETDEKLFQYVHIEGAHSPYDMDEDLNPIADGKGTYNQKIGAAAKIADLAVKRLKESGAYDNSVIVIMSDHGWHTRDAVLYVKGFDEKHSEMKVSDRQVSWADLDAVFVKLASGMVAEDAFGDIPTEGRKRYYYVNPYYDREPMVEYMLDGGRSYNEEDWIKTGVEYPFPN